MTKRWKQNMAKTKLKKSIKRVKASPKGVGSTSRKPAKSAAAKKASKRAAAKPAAARRTASSGGTAAPGSTDIRQAYKNFLLADYLGEKKATAGRRR
jgi:hypothetical protein